MVYYKHKISKFITVIKNNNGLVGNVLAAFFIKGAGMIISLLSMPLYISYFNNNVILGVWFTILTVLSWILSFDIGIGNGLRNYLTSVLAYKDYEKGRELISSACAVLGILTIIFASIIYSTIPIANWNNIFNIDASVISRNLLEECVSITILGILITFFFQIIRGMFFALQLSSANNLLHFITNILLVVYLFVAPKTEDIQTKLFNISVAYSFIINIPYVISAIYIFGFSELKNCRPTFSSVNIISSKSVLGLGVSFFSVQVLYMVLNVTNEWFVTKFFAPEFCVEYQVYFRLFTIIGSLLMLAMSPLWSAITKAYAQKNFKWIIKLKKIMYALAFGCIIIQFGFVLILQPLVNFWLKENSIEINFFTALIFLFYSIETIWNSIQSTIAAGLGKLKISLACYSFAVFFKIAFIVIVSKYTNDWSIVVLATALGLLPYCIIQPFYINKVLIKLNKDENN